MTAAFAVAFGVHVSSATESLAVPVRISESSHAGCPKKPALRERLEVHLGHVRVPAEGEPAIDLALEIRKRDDLSVGTLTLTAAGASVQREASSTSCEDVIAALTMMAVIAIGEQAERFPTEPTKPSDQESAPSDGEPPASFDSSNRRTANTPNTPPQRAVLPPRSSGSRASKRVAFSFGSGFAVNGNRGAVLLGTWFAQVTLPMALDPSLRLGVSRSTRERASIARGAVAIRWVELIWAACADVYRHQSFRLGPCLNGELGRLEASVIRPLPARDIPSLWVSVGASAKMSWQFLPTFGVEMIAGVRAPILRRELFFEPFDQPLAYRAPVLAPFAEFGFVARLP